MEAKNRFLKLFNSIAYKHNRYSLFSDFVTMAAISMHNAIVMNEALEVEYLKLAGKYNKNELSIICELFACVVQALEVPQDFLGQIFMDLEISNARSGQFFTPYTLSKMMAKMIMPTDVILKEIEEHGFVKISEPACGASGSIVAVADVMMEAKINYQQTIWVQAVDIDSTCAMMSYLQLSLMHIPAEIVTGNTLTLEVFRTMKTPAHYLGNWDYKLSKRLNKSKSKVISINTESNIILPKAVNPIFSKPVLTEQEGFIF